jgi:hypothetical protein
LRNERKGWKKERKWRVERRKEFVAIWIEEPTKKQSTEHKH